MNIRTSSSVRSSLKSAAFRTVSVRDGRGLVYRRCREIVPLGRLRQYPFPAVLAFSLRGRIHTSHDVRTVSAGVLNARVPA